MQEREKQPLEHTSYELICIYGGTLQEEAEYVLYSNYLTVREIPYEI